MLNTQPKPYLINNFQCIGLADPFPKEERANKDVKPPCYVDELVYAESRYMEGLSPLCVYIPNKDIMFKIMRACIKVAQPADLWTASVKMRNEAQWLIREKIEGAVGEYLSDRLQAAAAGAEINK